MRFDIATSADADAVAALVNAAYRGGSGETGWTDETSLLSGARASANDVRSLIDAAPSTTLLLARAKQTGALLGCVAIEADVDTCTISMLAITPGSQTGGYGKALLAAAEQRAAQGGARVANMTVIRQRETLLAWYQRRGYRPTGAVEPFPYGNDRVGTPLRDDLEFVVLEKTL